MIEQLLNKNVYKLRILLTTKCNCRCPYCFVEKKDEFADYDVLEKGIRFLIDSAGDKKLVSLYGGEPLYAYENAQKIILFAKEYALKKHKRLVMAFVTNALMLEEDHMRFFQEHGVHLITSLIGEKKYQDAKRKVIDGSSTYDAVVAKLPLIRKYTKVEQAGICFCVFPDQIDSLFDNFKHVVSLGCRNLNMEPILDYKRWTKKEDDVFLVHCKKIILEIFESIRRRDFIFLRPISLEIAYNKLSDKFASGCLFNFGCVLYPDGVLAITPWVSKETHAVANLARDEVYRFSDCSFSSESGLCKECAGNYYPRWTQEQTELMAHRVYLIYHRFCLEAANVIRQKAKTDLLYAEYIEKVIENT